MYTIEEYNKKIDEKYKVDTYRVIKSNDTIKDRDRIVVKCCGCGTEREVNARSFIRLVAKTDKLAAKLECPICRSKRYKDSLIRPVNTLESIQKELRDKFEVLEYTNNRNIRVICKKCGSEFISSLSVLRKSNGCINCNGHKEYTKEDLQEITNEKFGREILVKSIWNKEYKNCKKHFVTVEYAGNEYSKSVSEFLRYGIERETRRNIDALKKEISDISNGKYSIKENEYRGRHAKYHFYNVLTGYCKEISFDNFMRNPKLETSMFSKYAVSIFKELNKHHIYFEKEKSYYGIGKRRFDISIPLTGDIIEIDGEQHFYNIHRSLLKTVQSDNIKNTFCQTRGKTLLRIPYTEINNGNYIQILNLFINKNFEELLKYNVLLVYNKKIFNENTYYEPTRRSLIKLLVENLSN